MEAIFNNFLINEKEVQNSNSMNFVPSFGKLKRRLRVLKIKNNEKTKRLRIATNKKHANDLQWKRKRANILKK